MFILFVCAQEGGEGRVHNTYYLPFLMAFLLDIK